MFSDFIFSNYFKVLNYEWYSTKRSIDRQKELLIKAHAITREKHQSLFDDWGCPRLGTKFVRDLELSAIRNNDSSKDSPLTTVMSIPCYHKRPQFGNISSFWFSRKLVEKQKLVMSRVQWMAWGRCLGLGQVKWIHLNLGMKRIPRVPVGSGFIGSTRCSKSLFVTRGFETY